MLHTKRALRKSLAMGGFEATQGQWKIMVKWWELKSWIGKKWHWKYTYPQKIMTQITGGIGKGSE